MRSIARLLLLSLLLAGQSRGGEPDGFIGTDYGTVFGRTVVADLPNAPAPGPYLGAMAVSQSGRTWLFGEFNGTEITTALPIARLDTASGLLDPGFGGGTGTVSTPFPIAGGTWYRDLNALVQADGKPVIAGRAEINDRDRGFVCRLNVAGNFDLGFGSGGCVTVRAFSFADERCGIEGLVIDALTGAITVVGHCSQVMTSETQAFTARFSSAGVLDAEYGAGAGVTRPQIPGASLPYLRSVALRADGRIMAVGTVRREPDQYDIALLRLSNDGTLDPEYADGGYQLLTVDLNGNFNDIGTGVAIRPDGRVLAMGTTESLGDDGEVILWQTTADGDPDPDFGVNGIAIGAEPLDDLFIDFVQLIAYRARMRLSIDDLGRAVVMSRVGSPIVGQDSDVKVFRFLPDGRRDRSFGDIGRGVVDVDNDVSLPGPGASDDIPTFILAERTRILLGTISVRDDKRYMVTLTLTGSKLFRDGLEAFED
jgi:uncharacterized delta-60 repeat protein